MRTLAFDGQRSPHLFAVFFQNAVQAMCNSFPLSFENYCQNFRQRVFIADSHYRYFYTKIFYNAVAFFDVIFLLL